MRVQLTFNAAPIARAPSVQILFPAVHCAQMPHCEPPILPHPHSLPILAHHPLKSEGQAELTGERTVEVELCEGPVDLQRLR